ncbi:hypothetical protein LCGC14_1821150 [marine sediment metagenome]|uniref:Uncharacterized protein n=2 Tax=marine sediment metagenome TaxID=412755 RepID=A0A0F9GIZ0_9ZZZZ
MSFFNPDVDKEICNQCWHRNKPYMSSFGAYTPCLGCKDGSNIETSKNKKPQAG